MDLVEGGAVRAVPACVADLTDKHIDVDRRTARGAPFGRGRWRAGRAEMHNKIPTGLRSDVRLLGKQRWAATGLLRAARPAGLLEEDIRLRSRHCKR